VGAGRLRWWSSGESRSDLNLRLHEQWQKEQGEKGFLPESERWPMIPANDLFIIPKPSRPMRIGSLDSYGIPEHKWVGQRWISDNFERSMFAWDERSVRAGLTKEEGDALMRVVSCPHVPENTAFIFQGEFNCALCAEEKAMNRIEYNSPLGWSVGVIRDLYASSDHIEVVAKAGGRKHSFPFVINLSRPAIGELEEALQYVAGKGFEPHEVRASQHVFIQLEKFMDDMRTARSLAAIINAPPPTVAGRVDLADYLLKEKHVGVAEYLSVLETGRLPEEKEAVTLTSPTGDKLTMHFPKERDMATSSKMTIEEYRKEYGEPKHVGEDVFCKCCGQKAERTFGPAPYECRMGLRPNIEGWMKVFFPIRPTFEGVMQESFDVCTSCAKKVSDYIVYVGKEKSGETGLSDEDLLADDA
jgi:hypothetical protein